MRNGVPPVLTSWLRGFLTQQHQRIKVGNEVSSWSVVNGGVPQGTLSGPELFRRMVSDLTTGVRTIKYVDDTTLVEVVKKGEPSHLQDSLNDVLAWCDKNKLYINPSKTKELLIHFFKVDPDVPPLVIGDSCIERVRSAKLLGVHISNDLKWEDHVLAITKKASSRLYYLQQLKRSGVQSSDLRQVYLSLVRPLVEYACQCWSTSLTQDQENQVERIQRRAFKIIMSNDSYSTACIELQGYPKLLSQ
jgi:hypothetical protein